ncbi:MAG: thiosulfate sulfurtransferase [Proteobacteria bacterium]|nr:thiosulfate sulfurtransferase [Pseudomonadota bacterium]
MTSGNPWVTAQWLDDLLHRNPSAETWRLLEVGYNAEQTYRAGHIPGAYYVDTQLVESLPLWNVVPPKILRTMLSRYGLRSDMTVILYSRGNYAAERLAQILLYAGVNDIRLLNGGWQSWQRAGLRQTIDQPPAITPQDFGAPLPSQPHFLLNMAQTRLRMAQPETLLVSVRSWDEFSGGTSGYHYISTAGDIPGARWGHAGGNSQFIADYHHPDGTVRSPQEIAALWQQQHITADKQVIFYCGTGWRASLAFLLARALGWPKIAVYDGGWFEWSQQQKTEQTDDKSENS